MLDGIREKMESYQNLSVDELTARINESAPGHFTDDELAEVDIRLLHFCCALLDAGASES